jgi:hypothetical protein
MGNNVTDEQEVDACIVRMAQRSLLSIASSHTFRAAVLDSPSSSRRWQKIPLHLQCREVVFDFLRAQRPESRANRAFDTIEAE